MMWYYADVARIAAFMFVRERRVPEMTPDAVGFLPYGDDEPTRAALRSSRFACLPDDPDAAHPDARPTRDLEALRAALVDTIDTFIAPAIEPMSRRMHLGAKALWGIAASAMLEPITEVAEAHGGAAAAVTEAEAVVELGGRLALAPPTYETIAHASRVELVSRLGVCCRAYLWPKIAHEKCDTCPIRSREDRIARQLDRRAAQPA
jgi:hypothetical protein